jgi:SAM-dependent methyltransferase
MDFKDDRYGRNYFEKAIITTRRNSKRARNNLQELLRHKRMGDLLEIGCGKGEFLELASQYFNVSGMDISHYAANLNHNPISERITQGNIEEAALDPQRFDAIAAFNVLEHLKQPGDVLHKLYTGLRHNGVLIGSVPLNGGVLGRVHTLLTNIFDRTHISTYSPGRWRRLFRESGFNSVRLFGEIVLFKNDSIFVRDKLWPYVGFNLMFVCCKASAEQ